MYISLVLKHVTQEEGESNVYFPCFKACYPRGGESNVYFPRFKACYPRGGESNVYFPRILKGVAERKGTQGIFSSFPRRIFVTHRLFPSID